MKTVACAVILQSIFTLGSPQYYVGDSCKNRYGNWGICSEIYDCPSVIEELEGGVTPTLCSFDHSYPVVCCSGPEVARSTTTTPRPTPPPKTGPPLGPRRKPGEAAKYYCEEYRKSFCPFALAVAGGTKALPHEFPHMAAIGYGEINNVKWGCGGTLVSERFVLTAAHCLHGGRMGVPKWVLLGTEIQKNGDSRQDRSGQRHPVVYRISHPGYKPPAKYNDVALLEIGPALESDALSTVSKELHPACLPVEDRTWKTRSAIATGWGRTGFGEDASPDLLKVELDILNTVICNDTYSFEIRTTDWLLRGIDSTMICAGKLEGGKDTCQGDSGGPLQVVLPAKCLYEVWGITSFGKVCAFANSPAVYMKVYEYLPWIESIIWPVEEDYIYFF